MGYNIAGAGETINYILLVNSKKNTTIKKIKTTGGVEAIGCYEIGKCRYTPLRNLDT